MGEHHVPKGVSLDTLREIVAGWAAVGAAVEPRYTADVEDATGISDAVGRQTRFLEDIGVLERSGQQHELTDEGQALAGALVAEDQSLAAERGRELLTDWELTETLRGVLRQNPMDRDDLVAVVASLAGADPSAGRVQSGVTTLLDLFEWTGVLTRDDDRYRLPEGASDEERDSTADGDDGPDPPDAIDGSDRADASRESTRLPVPDERTAPAKPAPARRQSESASDADEADGAVVAVPTVVLDGGASDSTPTIEFVSLSGGSDEAGIALGEVATAVSEAVESGTTDRDPRRDATAPGAGGGAATESSGGEGDGSGATGGRQTGAGSHALSLGVDVDADDEDLESIIAAVRRGLIDKETE
ncbi:hypothetical protein DJ69_10830 [Halorubrum persicum]|uniref:Uncharacterized protein n=1 Tax=Halorubrum persicum TaxID=1383844 RepID=A0A2G1WHX2_9EURY|nr:hypothetical protein [Halorubrum persicum]PHQ38580.1 hypothetical protein DJ69_10830 [Halorubrum persicum]